MANTPATIQVELKPETKKALVAWFEEQINESKRDMDRELKKPDVIAMLLRRWLSNDATQMSIPEAVDAWGTVVMLERHAK